MSHDQQYAYVPDTTVHDPEDWRTPHAEGEEDEMQVSLDGKTWCRELLGAVDVTACGEPFRFSIVPRRRPQLEGSLCLKCFTPREVADAMEVAEKAKRDADAFIGINPRRRK